MDEQALELASELAFARLEEVGGDLPKLEEPYRTVATIVSAQGVIDDGGLRYFFENDWPGQPPYSVICDAYRRIGACAQADAIGAAAELFACAEPERDARRRLELLSGPIGQQIEELDEQLASDAWRLLSEYVEANRAGLFGARS